MEGSAAELPDARGEQPVPALRASDAERDQVVAKLKDEFVAGRLSHDTFLYRVDLVLGTRRQADLPPLVADLPARPLPGGALVGWIRGTWARMTGSGATQAPGTSATGQRREAELRASSAARRPAVMVTTGMKAAPGRRQPFLLQFPRASGDRFTIGRDASCDLAVADLTVSRQHAQLERRDSGWLLSDLESTNGTRVNGWRVRGQVPVRPGDLVSFGNLEVIFAVPSPGG
ncbi:MAG: FHA domain-containing protein [Trebonia sp.]